MYVIGISCFYHDSSICLFKDNELVFACEEERFTGKKHDSSFPYNGLKYILDTYNISLDEIEKFCFYETPRLKLGRILKNYIRNPILSFSSTKDALISLYDNTRILKKEFGKNIYYQPHHHSHIYYSYYTSGFKDAVVVSVDGVGETDTVVVAVVKNGKFTFKPLMKYPQSLGLFYSTMTSFLGFKPNNGEYKLMGLAGFGDSSKYYDVVKKLNMNHFIWNKSNKIMFNETLSTKLGIPNRLPEEEILQVHKDVAAAVQRVYETELFTLLNKITEETDIRNLCLGGGCAYNGVANGKIKKYTPFVELWIPPAPSDAGSSVGAVLGYLHYRDGIVSRVKETPFLGPEYSDEDIISQLPDVKLKRVSDTQLYEMVSEELQKGKVVGWLRGKSEFGARALGHRSILANPFIDGTRHKVNSIIKKREGFRPFAPMVRFDVQSTYFKEKDYVPYMNQVVEVKKEYRDLLKEVSNVDGTARIQSIQQSENPTIHKLLTNFSEKTGNPPILLNTSFNVRGQTMVLTPRMAYDTFLNTDIGVLILNNFIIIK
jgi:carbamoyltransferase